MKSEPATIYRCDYCGFRFLTHSGARRHETACQCRKCKHYCKSTPYDWETSDPGEPEGCGKDQPDGDFLVFEPYRTDDAVFVRPLPCPEREATP